MSAENSMVITVGSGGEGGEGMGEVNGDGGDLTKDGEDTVHCTDSAL